MTFLTYPSSCTMLVCGCPSDAWLRLTSPLPPVDFILLSSHCGRPLRFARSDTLQRGTLHPKAATPSQFWSGTHSSPASLCARRTYAQQAAAQDHSRSSMHSTQTNQGASEGIFRSSRRWQHAAANCTSDSQHLPFARLRLEAAGLWHCPVLLYLSPSPSAAGFRPL